MNEDQKFLDKSLANLVHAIRGSELQVKVVNQEEKDDTAIIEAIGNLGNVVQEKLTEVKEELKKKFESEYRVEIDPEKIRGKQGLPGKDGKNGIDGKPGKDGRDGKDGKDGKNGLNGKDGSPDTPEEIYKKLLSQKKRLPLSFVEGLEQRLIERNSTVS